MLESLKGSRKFVLDFKIDYNRTNDDVRSNEIAIRDLIDNNEFWHEVFMYLKCKESDLLKCTFAYIYVL